MQPEHLTCPAAALFDFIVQNVMDFAASAGRCDGLRLVLCLPAFRLQIDKCSLPHTETCRPSSL